MHHWPARRLPLATTVLGLSFQVPWLLAPPLYGERLDRIINCSATVEPTGACHYIMLLHVPCRLLESFSWTYCYLHRSIIIGIDLLDDVLHIKALSIKPDVIWWEVQCDRTMPFWRVRYFTSICDVHSARLPLMWTSEIAERGFSCWFLALNQISSYGAC